MLSYRLKNASRCGMSGLCCVRGCRTTRACGHILPSNVIVKAPFKITGELDVFNKDRRLQNEALIMLYLSRPKRLFM